MKRFDVYETVDGRILQEESESGEYVTYEAAAKLAKAARYYKVMVNQMLYAQSLWGKHEVWIGNDEGKSHQYRDQWNALCHSIIRVRDKAEQLYKEAMEG